MIDVYKIPLTLKAVIQPASGSALEFDIVNISMNFAVNSIPRATLLIPTGAPIKIAGKKAPANAETLFDIVKPATLKVYLTVGETNPEASAEFLGVTAGETRKIFDGYFVSVLPTRRFKEASFKVQAEHACAVLDSGDMFTYPYTNFQADLYAKFIVPKTNVKGSPLDVMFQKLSGEGSELVRVEWSSAKQDLMQNAIIPHILASTSFKSGELNIGAGCTKPEINNTAVKDYLSKLGAIPNGSVGTGNYSILELITPDETVALDRGIGRLAITRGSAWKLLVNMATELGLAIVPTIDRLCVVPHKRVSAPYMLIEPDHILNWDYTSATLQNVLGIRMMGDLYADTSLKDKVAAAVCQFLPDAPSFSYLRSHGNVANMTSPVWLASSWTAGLRFQTISSPPWKKPDKAEQAKKEAEDQKVKESMQKLNSQDSLANNYLKNTLIDLIYQGRRAILATNLRWDIAPGSLIGVTIPGLYSGSRGFVGCVSSVNYSLSSGGCTTLYDLTHVLTTEESQDSLEFTGENHYLFTGVWTGGKLDALDN